MDVYMQGFCNLCKIFEYIAAILHLIKTEPNTEAGKGWGHLFLNLLYTQDSGSEYDLKIFVKNSRATCAAGNRRILIQWGKFYFFWKR